MGLLDRNIKSGFPQPATEHSTFDRQKAERLEQYGWELVRQGWNHSIEGRHTGLDSPEPRSKVFKGLDVLFRYLKPHAVKSYCAQVVDKIRCLPEGEEQASATAELIKTLYELGVDPADMVEDLPGTPLTETYLLQKFLQQTSSVQEAWRSYTDLDPEIQTVEAWVDKHRSAAGQHPDKKPHILALCNYCRLIRRLDNIQGYLEMEKEMRLVLAETNPIHRKTKAGAFVEWLYEETGLDNTFNVRALKNFILSYGIEAFFDDGLNSVPQERIETAPWDLTADIPESLAEELANEGRFQEASVLIRECELTSFGYGLPQAASCLVVKATEYGNARTDPGTPGELIDSLDNPTNPDYWRNVRDSLHRTQTMSDVRNETDWLARDTGYRVLVAKEDADVAVILGTNGGLKYLEKAEATLETISAPERHYSYKRNIVDLSARIQRARAILKPETVNFDLIDNPRHEPGSEIRAFDAEIGDIPKNRIETGLLLARTAKHSQAAIKT